MKNKFPITKNLIASQHSGQFPPIKCQNLYQKQKKTNKQNPRCVKYSPKKEGIGTRGSDANLHMEKD